MPGRILSGGPDVDIMHTHILCTVIHSCNASMMVHFYDSDIFEDKPTE